MEVIATFIFLLLPFCVLGYLAYLLLVGLFIPDMEIMIQAICDMFKRRNED
jgi:hypothetical protein